MKLSFPPEIASALKGKKIFCSLSGGADSLALLLFLDLHKEAAGFALEAVHFEHGFRGRASIADAAFCKRLCMQRNIPCALFRIDVPNNRAAVSITNGDPRSAQDYIKTLEDVGFTLNEVEISMADTEE